MVIFLPVLENKYAVHHNNIIIAIITTNVGSNSLLFLFQEKVKIHYHETCFALEVWLYYS